MANTLDKSWYDKAAKDINSTEYSIVYINGATDFQQRLIKVLEEKLLNPLLDIEEQSYLDKTIELLKTLKAE